MQAKYAPMGAAAFIIIATPILIALVSELLSGFTLDTSISTAFGFFVVIHSFLFELDPIWGGLIVSSPYIAIFVFLCWKFKVFRPMMRRAAELKRKASQEKFMPRYWGKNSTYFKTINLQSAHSKTHKPIIFFHCYVLFLYLTVTLTVTLIY